MVYLWSFRVRKKKNLPIPSAKECIAAIPKKRREKSDMPLLSKDNKPTQAGSVGNERICILFYQIFFYVTLKILFMDQTCNKKFGDINGIF